jgi:hypothetical protein
VIRDGGERTTLEAASLPGKDVPIQRLVTFLPLAIRLTLFLMELPE